MSAGSNGRPPLQPGTEALRRFYKVVTVGPHEAEFTVLLDGRPVRTPARNALAAPEPIAQAMAVEWDAQEDTIEPRTMPFTRLVNTAIDGVAQNTDAVRADIAQIAGNDLIVYRADAPAGLVANQNAHWDPVAAFAERTLDVRIVRTTGIMPLTQPDGLGPAILAALPREPLALAAFHQLTTLTGSAFIALSAASGHITFDAAWDAAHVDEDWNIKEWGEDAEAAARRAARRKDAAAASAVLEWTSTTKKT